MRGQLKKMNVWCSYGCKNDVIFYYDSVVTMITVGWVVHIAYPTDISDDAVFSGGARRLYQKPVNALLAFLFDTIRVN